MIQIALEQIEFFAYHGFYKEEQKIGNKYAVDIQVEINPQEERQMDDKLKDTVNYEELYKIVKAEMKTPAKLLETIAFRIIKAVMEDFASVNVVEVRVSKFNPPIGGVCARASVCVRRTREQVLAL
ncbi:MAG: dihydroneopterin aldolase [Cytophagales bacterium]|nr:dihydroneopterin aldolase [Cytophagales bacterium]